MSYTPDRWVVVNIKLPNSPDWIRVFAGWYGGYLGSDSWQLSSGVSSVKETEEAYEFTNESGSVYVCNKNAYGMSSYMSSMFSHFESEIEKMPGTIEIVDGYA